MTPPRAASPDRQDGSPRAPSWRICSRKFPVLFTLADSHRCIDATLTKQLSRPRTVAAVMQFLDPKIGSSVTPAQAGVQNVAHERTARSGFRPAPE